MYIFFFSVEELYCKLNYHVQKIRQTPARDIQNHWTAVSTLLGLLSSLHHDLPHLGRRGPGGDRVLCKKYGCNLLDTFRLIGRTIAMTS